MRSASPRATQRSKAERLAAKVVPADRQRHEGVGGLAEPACGELAHRPLPVVVVRCGAGQERRDRTDERHARPQLGQILDLVAVDRHDDEADRLHHRHLVGHLGERGPQGGHLAVEGVPQDRCLGVEVAEEGAAAHPGAGGDLLDGGLLEALLGEQLQRDQLQAPCARAGRPAAARAVVLAHRQG